MLNDLACFVEVNQLRQNRIGRFSHLTGRSYYVMFQKTSRNSGNLETWDDLQEPLRHTQRFHPNNLSDEVLHEVMQSKAMGPVSFFFPKNAPQKWRIGQH